MRSRRSSHDQVAEVARRRLDLLGAELAAIRPAPVDPPSPVTDGSGEPPAATGRLEPPDAVGRVPVPVPAPGRHARRPVGHGPVGVAWLQDRLPPAVQGLRLGAAHVSFVAVLVAIVLGFSAWWTVRADDPGDLVPARSSTDTTAGSPTAVPSPTTLPPPEPAATSATAGGPATADPVPTGVLVVDVAGKVRRPGIARLAVGSRVVDALAAAEGVRRGVDLRDLNLARPLVDGEQVRVGIRPVPGVAASAASAPGAAGSGAPPTLVPLNTADQATLESLPGVGPVTAQAILQWRVEHGAYSAVEELLDVPGIGEATLARLAPLVTL